MGWRMQSPMCSGGVPREQQPLLGGCGGGGGTNLEHLHEDHGDFVRLGELGERRLELVQHGAHLGLLRLRRGAVTRVSTTRTEQDTRLLVQELGYSCSTRPSCAFGTIADQAARLGAW